MIKVMIVGAGGYTGAKLAYYLARHPVVELVALTVSATSQDANKCLSDASLHPQLKGIVDLPLIATDDYSSIAKDVDVVFVATDHQVSHDIIPELLKNNCLVFDLSAAFRVNNLDFYAQFYGFEHQYPNYLSEAAYGLAEWNGEQIKQAQLIAVPGCYPTAAQLALKPLIVEQLLDKSQLPIINAISGVSGAGRKASQKTHLCEVSLEAYGIFEHRHKPEISHHLEQEVIFIPHLGHFSQGIHETIICKVIPDVTRDKLLSIYNHYYHQKPLVRIYQSKWPALKAVVGTPYCDIGFMLQDQHLIIIAVEDNLLKGAATQAIQCMNIRLGFDETVSLI